MDALASRAEWRGAVARRYATQLLKHFQHRLPVTLKAEASGADRGSIVFEAGTCSLHAEGETLTLLASASDPQGLAQVQNVMSRHFERFAFREGASLAWQPA